MKLVKEHINEHEQESQFIEKAERHIMQDINSDKLNKKVIKKTKDVGGDEILICTINGDFVRDKNPGLDFNQFVDGGHHYVTSYPVYKKHIPENEIWIDDVFEFKPDDLRAFIQHEFTERNLMKYKHWSYDKAHDYANKKETDYDNKLKDKGG